MIETPLGVCQYVVMHQELPQTLCLAAGVLALHNSVLPRLEERQVTAQRGAGRRDLMPHGPRGGSEGHWGNGHAGVGWKKSVVS